MGALGIQEIGILILFVVVFFGSKRIPELMKGVGKGVKEYRNVMKEVTDEFDDVKKEITK